MASLGQAWTGSGCRQRRDGSPSTRPAEKCQIVDWPARGPFLPSDPFTSLAVDFLWGCLATTRLEMHTDNRRLRRSLGAECSSASWESRGQVRATHIEFQQEDGSDPMCERNASLNCTTRRMGPDLVHGTLPNWVAPVSLPKRPAWFWWRDHNAKLIKLTLFGHSN